MPIATVLGSEVYELPNPARAEAEAQLGPARERHARAVMRWRSIAAELGPDHPDLPPPPPAPPELTIPPTVTREVVRFSVDDGRVLTATVAYPSTAVLVQAAIRAEVARDNAGRVPRPAPTLPPGTIVLGV